jgi:hypothetical protein
MGRPSLRQLSTTERIAATFGPACALPTWIQFLRPIEMGRMEFSARLFDSSSSGYSRNRARHSTVPGCSGRPSRQRSWAMHSSL